MWICEGTGTSTELTEQAACIWMQEGHAFASGISIGYMQTDCKLSCTLALQFMNDLWKRHHYNFTHLRGGGDMSS